MDALSQELFFSHGEWHIIQQSVNTLWGAMMDGFEIFRTRFPITEQQEDAITGFDYRVYDRPCTVCEVGFFVEVLEYIMSELGVGKIEFECVIGSYDAGLALLDKMYNFLINAAEAIPRDQWFTFTDDEWKVLYWTDLSARNDFGTFAGLMPLDYSQCKEFWATSNRVFSDRRINQLYQMLTAQLNMFGSKENYTNKTVIPWDTIMGLVNRMHAHLDASPYYKPHNVSYRISPEYWDILTTTYQITARHYPYQDQWWIAPPNPDLYWDTHIKAHTDHEISRLYQTFHQQLLLYPSPEHYQNLTGIDWETAQHLRYVLKDYLITHKAHCEENPIFTFNDEEWTLLEVTSSYDNHPYPYHEYQWLTSSWNTASLWRENVKRKCLYHEMVAIYYTYTNHLNNCSTPQTNPQIDDYEWYRAQHLKEKIRNYLTQTQTTQPTR